MKTLKLLIKTSFFDKINDDMSMRSRCRATAANLSPTLRGSHVEVTSLDHPDMLRWFIVSETCLRQVVSRRVVTL